MIKNKIKRINKKKTVLFICSFLGFTFLMIFMDKLFGFRGHPYSWEEIGHSLPFTIIGSLGFAAWVTWGGLGDELIETFSDGFFRKRKNEKNEK